MQNCRKILDQETLNQDSIVIFTLGHTVYGCVCVYDTEKIKYTDFDNAINYQIFLKSVTNTDKHRSKRSIILHRKYIKNECLFGHVRK
jgi:hypothetical protein